MQKNGTIESSTPSFLHADIPHQGIPAKSKYSNEYKTDVQDDDDLRWASFNDEHTN